MLHNHFSFYSYFTCAAIERIDFTRVPFREKSFDKVDGRETPISNLQKSDAKKS